MEKMAAFKTDGDLTENNRVGSDSTKDHGSTRINYLYYFKRRLANFMGVKTLLDELCKFVAEMIAQRTPNKILDYFNIARVEDTEERIRIEDGLIATHKWIDPEGLIAKDRERR